MLDDAPNKHLPDEIAIENFILNNVYSLREDPRLEQTRNKASRVIRTGFLIEGI